MGPLCKILTSAVVAHECFAALAAGSGMPMRIQAVSCTGPYEAVLSETAGAARNRSKVRCQEVYGGVRMCTEVYGRCKNAKSGVRRCTGGVREVYGGVREVYGLHES